MTSDRELSFGALLKSYRRSAELSQEQLAERAGYSVVYVRKLEGGTRRPTRSTVELLARALELDAGSWDTLLEAGRQVNRTTAGRMQEVNGREREEPVQWQSTGTQRREAFDAVLVAGEGDRGAVHAASLALHASRLSVWTEDHPTIDFAGALPLTDCVLLFIGAAGLPHALHDDLAAGLSSVDEEWRPRVLLVLLPGAADPFDPSTLPSSLSTSIWVDLRGGLGETAMSRVRRAVEGESTEHRSAVPPNESPYRGLEAFDEGTASLFFGRDGDIQRLLERLKSTNLLAVLGPSGSGKSSLVRAGLMPALRSSAIAGSDRWTLTALTPGVRPLTGLAAQLVRLCPRSSMQHTLDKMAGDARSLHLATVLALVDRPPGDRLVWVIDQFEELFILCQDEVERRAFLANLMYAASAPDSRTVVIPTMRADFYHHCAPYGELAAGIAAHQYLVGPLERRALRQAIEGPALCTGLELEGGLVDRILGQVTEGPGILPLMEYSLLELWQRRDGNLLTLAAYRETGGVQGAIPTRAESVFARFTGREQSDARQVLLRLTEVGDGVPDTRRRARLSELPEPSEPNGTLERVVDALVDARLLVASQDENGEGQIEIAHEALIRGWPRLRQWIDEDRAGLRVHRRLSEAAQEWVRAGRDRGGLYRGVPLAVARDWRDRHSEALNKLENEFLDSAIALEQHERRAVRRRLVSAGAGLVSALVVISLVALFALQQRQEAIRERNAAFSAIIAQRATAQLGLDRELSTLLAVDAVHAAPSGLAVDALRAALATFPLEQQLRGQRGAITCAVFSPDGQVIATSSRDGSLWLWSTQSGRRLRVVRTSGAPLTAAQFSPSGREIVAASAAGDATIWEVRTGRRLLNLRAGNAALSAASFSPDGRRLLTGGKDGTARLWDSATGQLRRVVQRGSYAVESAAFSPDGHLVATGTDDGVVRIWSVGTSQPARTLSPHQEAIYGLAFDRDGRSLAVAAGNGEFWDIVTRRIARRFRGDQIQSVAVSPDGRWVATGSGAAVASVWDSTGKHMGDLPHLLDTVNSVAFSPSGQDLLTGGEDGTADLYLCDACGSLNHLLTVAAERVHRSLTPQERRLYLPNS